MIIPAVCDSSLGATDSGGTTVFEDLVPSPTFSGQIRSDDAPNAIGFAPATTQLATPMTHGTPMADFIEEPQVLRDWDDTFVTRGLTELVITWPDLEDEWRLSMAKITEGRNHVSRAELARFVVEQFSLFTEGANSRSSPEWRLGEASDAYSIRNTSLAFLWSPAPGVWQPAFRVGNRLYNTEKEPFSQSASEPHSSDPCIS